MDDVFCEQVKTIRNFVEIISVLTNLSREDLLPTVLELLLVEVQDIVNGFCVVKDA